MDTVISPHALPPLSTVSWQRPRETAVWGHWWWYAFRGFAGEYLKYASIATVDDRNAVAEAVRRSVLALEMVAKAGGR